MDTDRNLLFGVLALQADLIDAPQFIEACLLWTTRKAEPLADLLVGRGWINPADRAHIEYLLERKLQKHGGNVHASLAAIPVDVKQSLAALGDDDIQRSLAGAPLPAKPPAAATIDHVPRPAERYTRLQLHATGGIGRVWLAHDRELGRDVALKELRPEHAAHATLEARFLQEAQITGQLEHPGVIPVYELVHPRDGGQPFYTMRFVKGRTLSEAARAYHERRAAGAVEPLELPALLNAFVTVCNTVAYAHARGVIHRDLKGQNVLLGDFGEVVILDWGLAKLVGHSEEDQAPSVILGAAGADSGYTVQGQALGTPAYMAPEQSAGRLDLIDRHTDVYGLGAILYELLTGAPPFSGDSTEEVLRKVCEEQPVPPRQLWPEVPPALENLCLRALAKTPAERPAAAAELAHEVQGWQEFERRKAEEALRESEALYHSLVETLPCIVVRKDLQGRFAFANHGYSELLGRPIDQILGRTDIDFFPPAMVEKYRRDDRTVLETGQVLETIDTVPGETGPRYAQVLKTAVRDAAGKVTGIQLIAWDVTARILAEEELRKSRERYELAVLGSQDGLWDWDVGTGALYLSPWYKQILGWDEHEFPSRIDEWERWLHPEDRAAAVAARQAHLEGKTAQYESEHRLLHKDGSYRWVRTRGVAVRDAAGRPYRVAGSIEDITRRRLAEQELAQERHLLHVLMDNLPDGIYFKDTAGRFLRVNQAVANYFGVRDQAEVVGKTDFDFFTEDFAAATAATEQVIIRIGQPLVDVEERVTLRDGRVEWVSTTKLPYRDQDGTIIGTFGVSRNITARKRAEGAP